MQTNSAFTSNQQVNFPGVDIESNFGVTIRDSKESEVQNRKTKKMQIIMEGEVEKKKGKTMFSSSKKYWMLLTSQPRLFLLSEFKMVKDEPQLQTYQKDILLHPQLKVRTIKRNAFQIECQITQKKQVFKAETPGDWVLNINKMIEMTSMQKLDQTSSIKMAGFQ